MKRNSVSVLQLLTLLFLFSCSGQKKETTSGETANNSPAVENKIRLINLDPGHFHAALVQKSMYPNVDPQVHVFAPEGPDVQEYLKKINQYNARAESPTEWQEEVYTGPDY